MGLFENFSGIVNKFVTSLTQARNAAAVSSRFEWLFLSLVLVKYAGKDKVRLLAAIFKLSEVS
jgi:hypothetical protein